MQATVQQMLGSMQLAMATVSRSETTKGSALGWG
jgi:hypothetical protein